MSHHIKENINSFNTNISFNNVSNNYTAADEKAEILAWISPLEPQIRHHDIRTRRVDGVGDWLLKTQEFQNWLGGICEDGSDGTALFCYGGPGVGKSYISSLVIDTLCKQAVEENAAIACFYFDFAAQEEQSLDAILGSVLKQVVGGLDEVPERIVKAFRRRGRVVSGQKLVRSEIVEFLRDITSSRPTFICIDALDECLARHRVELLGLLNQILQKAPGARLFLTGRPHIRGEVEDHLNRAATRSITPAKNDIITLLRAKLKEDTMPDAMDESLVEEIIQMIPETVSEIFLLASLSIDMILQETTICLRREKLREMQSNLGLGGAYEKTMERIKAQGKGKESLGMAVLMWISHSRRPLQVDEIRHALAIRIESNDLNSDNIPTISTMLACCQGLATIENGTSTVRLIHYTLQEYLFTLPDLVNRAHSTIAETCLTYLNLQHVKNHSAGPPPNPQGTPFFEYSSLYWGIHMRRELSDRAKTLALQLLNQFDSHISTKFLWGSINGAPDIQAPNLSNSFYVPYIPDQKGFSALHCSSYFGIAELADTLINMDKWDINQRDGVGMTPLIWAARYGHEEVVRLLLRKKNIPPDQQDTNSGRTALSWAAGNGHEEVVKFFLEPRFVNPGSRGRRWGKAALVTDLVLGGRYVNPNSSSESGRTPLSWAARNGHEGIVKLLLEREDVDRDSSSNSGRTPLSWAAMDGHEGIVKLLLEREDVDRNSSCNSGRTSLSWAAMNGHEGIVKLLLDRTDVNPDTTDTYSQTPLSWAAESGHAGIVKLLLDRQDVYPDTRDPRYGQTLLSWAAMNGHEGTVKLLLEREDVDRNSSCNSGRTPLSWAASNGCERVVTLLLGQKNVNPDTRDKNGQTPLSLAAANGHEGIVKLLLLRDDVNPSSSSESGQTPLKLAAENGHDRVVEILQARHS